MHSKDQTANTAAAQQVSSEQAEAGSGTPAIGHSSSVEPKDSHNFEEIYEGHFGFVWRTLRRYGVPEASLDDASQDVFMVVHSRLESFEGRSSLRTWIFGICRRVARSHRPSTRAMPVENERLEALPEVDARSPDAALEQVEAARLFQRLLHKLQPDKREAFILIEVEQMSINDAADALGTNANTVYSRLRAARQELEKAVKREVAHTSWRGQCPT